ncbi:dethiobiotin synthase [Gordonia soli]|uniref:ATP-dependent dethiobiotin synthetase BioD n=1 Tax=Gordonia soli NBRC 108243 TaxID=1223545 RepID=M0QRA1_9ACTN|nr:dethiobiotin synthase [Gordonia soli]GAC69992.1 ATP-dependent dethiobiotin synthetase BioD [Gordonia soli NBRC 108243]
MTRGIVHAVTGTSTDVGKTVVTAAITAAVGTIGASVAVCKPVQTGVSEDQPGDLADIRRLVGPVVGAECARYPDPLAPETAARRSGMPPVLLSDIIDAVGELAARHDVTLVEGAGGVLVRLAPDLTLLDVSSAVAADGIVVVVPAGLGTLNHAELTVGALRAHGLRPSGLVIGSWPQEPDLAMTCNRTDLSRLTGVPVVGVIPTGAGSLAPDDFRRRAGSWFDPHWLTTEFAVHRREGVPQ